MESATEKGSEARTSFMSHLSQLNDDELDNEDYTYKYERRFLSLSDDEVGDRLVLIEREKEQRRVEAR